MYKFNLIVSVLILTSTLFAGEGFIKKGNLYYKPGEIVIKIKTVHNNAGINVQDRVPQIFKAFKDLNIEEVRPLVKKRTLNKQTGTNLENILKIYYNHPIDPRYLAAKISKNINIEWAEPVYLYPVDFLPNDTDFSSQQNLAVIKAEEAWSLEQGDKKIIIAIVDTGIDWDHPDLFDNIWQNQGEDLDKDGRTLQWNGTGWEFDPDDINGIDDDGNGFEDDFVGWDFGGLNGTPDNNPVEDRPDHGTHVAGIASAVTNNSRGIASIGFNSSLMAVKTSRDDVRSAFSALIAYPTEGILYAVDNGADILNLSWGGYGYSRSAQEVIDYAVEKGVVVVGAAGNDNSSLNHYPSGYKGVISVGATNFTDQRASFSNYNNQIDVVAPGVGIFSTWQNNTYATLSGTSFSAPLVAGLAALMVNHFPDFNPLQIAEMIRVNTDNIDSQNPDNRLLGIGRINAFKALSGEKRISVRASNSDFRDDGDGDGAFEPGERISLGLEFTNYLDPVSNLLVKLESSSSFTTINNSEVSFGSLGTLDAVNNYQNRFVIDIDKEVPENFKIELRLTYSAGAYSDIQIMEISVNPTYVTQTGNDILLTFTSDGAFAFNDYPENLQGDGFRYQSGPNLMFEGALIYGTSSGQLMDAARISDQQSSDFASKIRFILSNPGQLAAQQGLSIFNDDGGSTAKLGIETELRTFTFDEEDYKSFVILKYVFINRSNQDIDNLYAGLFIDWDMDETDVEDNFAKYNSNGEFGYAFNGDGDPVDTYVGTALISSNQYGYYAIANDGTDAGFGIYDDFTDAEKWQAISGGYQKMDAGPSDISLVVSGGPFDIPREGRIDVAFAIAARNNLNDLNTVIKKSRTLYGSVVSDIKDENPEELPIQFLLNQNYPNPFNPETIIKYEIPGMANVGTSVDQRNSSVNGNQMGRHMSVPGMHVKLIIYDILGREIKTLVNEPQNPGYYEVVFDASKLGSGVYFYTLTAGSFRSTKKMMLLR